MTGTATFSDCGTYRYDLTRTWGEAPPLVFVCLNPSTADETVLDPTLRRVKGYAEREGAGGLIVVNLFALRSTDPSRLRSSPDPVGPDNLSTVLRHIRENETVVAAWGAHPMVGRSWVRACVLDEMRQTGRSLLCLGKTAGGRPAHPLYRRADEPLVAYP